MALRRLNNDNSELTVVADDLSAGRDEVLLHFRGKNLASKNWLFLYVSGATD
jgi:hypothetical protein